MSKTLRIYLSGSIKKSTYYGGDDHWSDDDKARIEAGLAPFKVQFLDPNIRHDSISDPQSTFGRDLLQVLSSDLIFVDARDKRGIGVGAEMAFAKMQRIPVVSLSPLESYYRRTNVTILEQAMDYWVHPFVSSLSDYLANTIEDGTCWIKEELLTNKAQIRGPECFEEGIAHYLNTQLTNEPLMHDIVHNDEQVSSKLCNLASSK